MDKAEFLTIFPTFERLEIVRKTLPSIIAETKGNNARLIVHDSSVNGQAEKWAYLQELNQNNDFFLILSDNLSMAHVRNMCLSLGQELYAPDYICMVEDDHGYNSGFIISAIQAMKQYYGLPSPVGDLKYGLFTGCRVHNRHLTQKLPDGNAYVDPNSPPEQMGRANSCCRCAPTSHWNNVLKGLDTDEYLISYYQTKHLNLRNYHKGFTTLLVESGEKMFELESEGRGDSIKSKNRMWDDNYAASDSRSVFLGKPETYKPEPWKRINSRIQLEISSDDSQEYRLLGDSLFKEGKFEDAAAYYQQAIALDDKSVWAYFGLGKSYQRSGRLPDAITTYKKAIEYNSSKPDIYHWLGEALVLAGKAKEATITYQKAINLNPNLAYPYRGLGGAMMELGCLEGAIANFKKSIELNPKYVLAYNHLAKALLAQGNLEEGISVYKKLLYFNPQGFSEYKNLANLCNLLVIKGQLNRAISCYKDAIKANPNNSEVAAKEIERLERLKNYNKQVNAAYAQIIELNGNPATVDSNFKWNGKKFLYLVQTDATPPPHYEDIPCEDADILYLSYKEEIEGYIYFPNSTWTQGRNKLLESAKQLKHRYLYYIFLDDDIEFVRGDWREFEALLLKYMPAIATPRKGNFDEDNRLVSEHNKIVDSQLEAQVVYSYDAMFNSFHRDVVFDSLVLPYIDKFDDVSWWHSQLISFHISQMLYPNHVLQFNHLMVKNELHRPYPQKANFAEVEKWLLSTIFNNNDVVKTIFLPHNYYSQYRVPEKPVKPLKSYRSSDNLKKLVLKSKSGFYNFHLYQHKMSEKSIYQLSELVKQGNLNEAVIIYHQLLKLNENADLPYGRLAEMLLDSLKLNLSDFGESLYQKSCLDRNITLDEKFLASFVDKADRLKRWCFRQFHSSASLYTTRFDSSHIKPVINRAKKRFDLPEMFIITDRDNLVIDNELKKIDTEEIDRIKSGGPKKVFICAFESDELLVKTLAKVNKVDNSAYIMPQVYYPTARYFHKNSLAKKVLEEETKIELGKIAIADFENLIQALEITRNVVGDYVEIGCFQGRSSHCVLNYMNQANIFRRKFFIDTFEGITYQEAEDSYDMIWHNAHGDPEKSSIEAVKNFLGEYEMVELIKMNIISDELPKHIQKIAVCNIDVDIYEAVAVAMNKVANLVVKGGIMIIEDQGHTPPLGGALLAMHEFFQTDIAKRFVPIHMASGQMFLIKIE